MLRAGACLWPVFVALAVTACHGDAATGDPDQPAGKVIELAGQVNAAREGAAERPLAVGAPVFADDTVTTAGDGSAVILLAHNQVRWSLGQGKSQRVDRSMAWKATADEGGSAFDDEEKMATASAGRHTDREAGDTAATAQLPPAQTEAAPALDQAVASADKPSPPPAPSKRRSESGAGDKGLLANKPPRGGDSFLDQPSGGGGGASPVGGAAAAIAPTAPSEASGDAAETASARKATTTRGASTGAQLLLGKLTVKGPLSAAEVGSRFTASFAKSCRGTAAGTVTLRFDIDPSGAVKNVRLTGSSQVVAPISACVSSAARALSFPAAAGGGTTTVERAITVR